MCLRGIYDYEYHSAAMDVSPDGPVSDCLKAGVQRQRRYYDSEQLLRRFSIKVLNVSTQHLLE